MRKSSAIWTGFVCLGVTLVLGVMEAHAQRPQIHITSPGSGATVSGRIALTAQASGAATVDYWVAGHSLVNGPLPASAPYSVTVDTAPLWDGPMQVVAVSRDAAGNVTGLSAPLNLIVQNGSTRGQLLAPDVSQTLSGTVTWQIQAADPHGIYALLYTVDGKPDRPHFLNVPNSAIDSYDMDTTQLANGIHYLTVQIMPLGASTPRGAGQVITQFMVNNGSLPLELRSNYRELYFQPGSTASVQLAPHLIYTDGNDQAVSGASFSTDNPAIANVTITGLVVPGAQQGIANIGITAGGHSATVMVTNITSHAGFAHFTGNGQIVYNYDSSQSLWVRTLFFTNAQLFYTYGPNAPVDVPGFAWTLHQAGVNAINSSFYSNPADAGIGSFVNWTNILGSRTQSWLDVARYNGFAFVGTGDDIQRNALEMNNTLNNPWAPDAIRYTLAELVGAGNVVSIEMQDEVGGPVPKSFRQVMSILNSAPSRPPVTWPVAGLQAPSVFAAWMGDPTLSDYASMYWSYGYNFRPEFAWGNSLWQTKSTLDGSILGKLAGLQIDKPKYMEVQATGPSYFKHVAGDRFQFGLDELALAPTPPEELTAEILYAAAKGFCGIRAYGYDGVAGFNDGLWATQRAAAALDPADQNMQQTGASPFTGDPDVSDRWQALSNGFNLIQTLEPYMLSIQIHAVDLGQNIATGARQLGGNSGRMLIAINMSDNLQTPTIDFGSYRYAGAGAVVRYHVAGLLSTRETVANDPWYSVSMAPGEAIVWVFTPPASGGAGGTDIPAAAPSVTVSSPSANQTVSGSITLSATASSDLGIASLQFSVDGRNSADAVTPAPDAASFTTLTGQITLDTSALSDGVHAISAIATDTAGNQSTATPVAITVSNHAPPPPVLPVTNGPAAEWFMSDGSGTTAADNSGNNRPLTLYGNPSWSPATACKLASCLTFDGASQSAAAALDLSGTKSVTVVFWMNVPSYNNNDELALEFASSPYGFNGSTGGFLVDPNSSQGGGGFFETGIKGDAGYNQVLFSRPSANTWHQYAIVFDKTAPAASQVTPYVDGVAVKYTHMTNSANTNTFANDTLNVMSRNGQVLFGKGSMQDLQIYSRALSATEIAALAGN